MNYRIIRLRNWVSMVAPWLMTFIERLRAAFVYLPSLHREGLRLPMIYFLKRGMIARFASQAGARVLVETGTYFGDTPWQLRHLFTKIWTIEVHPPLADLAKERFARVPHVTVVQADSAQALKDIVPQISEPVLYWLDGHYTGRLTGMGEAYCPIFAELDTVTSQTKSSWVAMIDDARLFGTEEGYPTLESLFSYLDKLHQPPFAWVENDIVFVVPQNHPLAQKCQLIPGRAMKSLLYDR
jgi:hypothetical protein